MKLQLNVGALLTLTVMVGNFCLSTPALAEVSSQHRTRISRPAHPPSPAQGGAPNAIPQSGEQNSTASGMQILAQVEEPTLFKSTGYGMSMRWWRKFKNPSFCPYVLCGSSCSDISGIPRVGAYSDAELVSEKTPCGLSELNALDKPGCCMSDTIDSSYSATSKGASCSGASCGSNSSCAPNQSCSVGVSEPKK